MAGINLSQSLQEKQAMARGSFFDTGLLINFVILLVSLAVFGGAHWYLGNLEKQSLALDDQAIMSVAELRGPEAERVADFRERLDTIFVNIELQPDPEKLFSRIEKASIPAVKLTKYNERWEEGMITMEGVTDNLKFVAQEMLALKQDSAVNKVSLKSITIEKDKKFHFTLIVDIPHPTATQTNP